jgi:hypothetical protein
VGQPILAAAVFQAAFAGRDEFTAPAIFCRFVEQAVSPAFSACNDILQCFALAVGSTRKSMFGAQFFENFLHRLQAASLEVLVSLPDTFDRFLVVLPFPVELVSQGHAPA